MTSTPNKSKQNLRKYRSVEKNDNVQYLGELQNITPGMTGKDLTEKHKLAFMAMMRIACDPKGKSWAKRKEKLDRQRAARIEAESKQRMEMAKEVTIERETTKKGKSLKVKIEKMRAEGGFPMRRERREDPSRRYGFIPRSQKKANIVDYVKA